MSLTDVSNNSFIGMIAREAGITLGRAKELLSSPGTALSSKIFPSAAAAFLTFAITNTQADARNQLEAHRNGSAEGLVEGFNFGSAKSGMTVIQKEEQKRYHDTLHQITMAFMLDAGARAEATQEMVERILAKLENGQTTVKREDIDTCIRDYMKAEYEYDIEEDPMMQDFHDDIRRHLEEDHQIRVVILYPHMQATGMDLAMA